MYRVLFGSSVESVVCKELEHRMECGIEDSPL